MTMITPYLPKEAIQDIKAWQKLGHPAFQLAVEYNGTKPLRCKNCADLGQVHVRLLAGGPYQTPLGLKNVFTWFDGDGVNGKGWYKVDKTLTYTCPHCKGELNFVEPAPAVTNPLTVQQDIGYLVHELEAKR